MRHDKLVSDLLGCLDLSGHSWGNAEFLGVLQQWLKPHLSQWDEELRTRWGLDRLAGINLSSYPLEETSLNPDEEIRQLRSVRPASMELIAMRIRDIFWAGTTVYSTVMCPNCGDAQLRILEDEPSEAVVLSCDVCAWSQSPKGEPWRGARRLGPISKVRLQNWRHSNR